MDYWPLGLFFFALAISMGLVMAPATDSVMGAVPRERAGVASAMNDLTRQVGGALGVAVIGSIVATLYSDRVSDATAGLPAPVQGPAEESIGAAVAVSRRLPADQGAGLADSAADAFTEAMSIGFLAAAGVAVLGAILAWRRLPDRDASRAAARAEPARA